MTPSVRQVVLFNNIYPGASVALDFTAGRYRLGSQKGNAPSLLSGFTFTRASTGYAETAAGALAAFASGSPRITDKGILVEEARTNLLVRSQQFDDANWTKDATTITADALAALDGTVTADALYETTATAAHQARQTTSSLTSGTAYTCTFYAKAGTRSIVSQGIDGLNAWFNLGTGAVGTVEAGLTASIQAMGGGWYRCITNRTPSVTAAKSFGIYACTTNGAVSYTGDATSPALYIWGAQLEAGAFPTSYIPTTTASATRAADVVSVSGLPVMPAALTLVAEFSPIAISAAAVQALALLCNGTDAERAMIYVSSATKSAIVSTGGAAQAAITVAGAAVADTVIKGALRVQANNFNAAFGGTLGLLDSSGAVPSGLTELRLGSYAAGTTNFANSYLRRALVYPYAMTDAQLQGATT